MKVSERSLNLDILRGFAILLAMGWHMNHLFEGPTAIRWLLFPGARFGWAGVDLFFVLSGFLVSGLIFREIDHTGGFDLKRFFIRRVFRLWPALYFFLFAMALSGITPISSFFWQIAFHLQNYIPTQSATHLWSLAVEEHFYILFSLCIYFFLWAQLGIGSMPVITIAIIVGTLVLRIIGLSNGAEPVELQTMTHFRLDGISAGVLLSYLSHHKPAIYHHLLRQTLLWLLVLCGSLIFLTLVPKSSPLGSTVGYSISALASVAALLLIQFCRIPKWIYLFARMIAFLGLVSYPLYLWHVPVTRIVERFNILPHGMDLFLAYTLSIGLAFMVTFLIERPMMRLRDELTR